MLWIIQMKDGPSASWRNVGRPMLKAEAEAQLAEFNEHGSGVCRLAAIKVKP